MPQTFSLLPSQRAPSFLIDSCGEGESSSHKVYWIEGRAFFTLPWPPKNENDFKNTKKIEFVTDLNKNLYRRTTDVPGNAPVGQYQSEDWGRSFILDVARKGIIIHVTR